MKTFKISFLDKLLSEGLTAFCIKIMYFFYLVSALSLEISCFICDGMRGSSKLN